MRVSCWARQRERRDSRGWKDWVDVEEVVREAVLGGGALRRRFERRVSWTPGAEGAPRGEGMEVGCGAEGTMRRVWEDGGVSGVQGGGG